MSVKPEHSQATNNGAFEIVTVEKGLYVVENTYAMREDYFSRGVPNRVQANGKVVEAVPAKAKKPAGRKVK
jgi:hypothetical protein